MKKLLIATDNFLPRWDGVSRFLSEIVPQLESLFDITIMSPKFKGDLKGWENRKLKRFDMTRIKVGDIVLAWPNHDEMKKLVADADIVWVQTLGPIGGFAVLQARKLNKPVVTFVHSVEWELFSKGVKWFKPFVYIFAKFYARWLYGKCQLMMVPSLETEELYTYNGIMTPKKVVHLGMEAKRKVGINPEHYVIGYTGRIAREKDIMTLYRAFMKLRKERQDVMLILVGDGIEPYMKMLSADEHVILPGSVNNIQEYLQAMDIFVLPSLTETSSLSTMEAMACGVPVVTTKVGFVKRYVHNKENGLFFPKGNDVVLKIKLIQLLEHESLRKRLGENARKTITERYMWSSTVERIKAILLSLDSPS